MGFVEKKNEEFLFYNNQDEVTKDYNKYSIKKDTDYYGIFNSKIEAEMGAIDLYNQNEENKIFYFNNDKMQEKNIKIIVIKTSY